MGLCPKKRYMLSSENCPYVSTVEHRFEMPVLGSERPSLGSEWPDFGSGSPDFVSGKPGLGSEKSVMESERPDLWSKRLDLGSKGLYLQSSMLVFRLEGMYRWTGGKQKLEKIALRGIIGHRPLQSRCPKKFVVIVQ